MGGVASYDPYSSVRRNWFGIGFITALLIIIIIIAIIWLIKYFRNTSKQCNQSQYVSMPDTSTGKPFTCDNVTHMEIMQISDPSKNGNCAALQKFKTSNC